MTLSADTLNQRSPYALTQLGDLTFRFVVWGDTSKMGWLLMKDV